MRCRANKFANGTVVATVLESRVMLIASKWPTDVGLKVNVYRIAYADQPNNFRGSEQAIRTDFATAAEKLKDFSFGQFNVDLRQLQIHTMTLGQTEAELKQKAKNTVTKGAADVDKARAFSDSLTAIAEKKAKALDLYATADYHVYYYQNPYSGLGARTALSRNATTVNTMTPLVLVHEMGHSIGFDHNGFQQVGEGQEPFAGTTKREAGHPFSVMGYSYNLEHFIANNKFQAGWLSWQKNSHKVKASDLQAGVPATFELIPYDTTELQEEGLYRVQLSERGTTYSLSLNQTHQGLEIHQDGLRDAHPETKTAEDALLGVGETLTFPGGTRLALDSIRDGTATISLSRA